MASVKKIETTYGNVRIVTGDHECIVQRLSDAGICEGEVAVDEGQLIEAVLEYAHERGLRRMRKTPTAKAPKTRKPRAKANGSVDAAYEKAATAHTPAALSDDSRFGDGTEIPA